MKKEFVYTEIFDRSWGALGLSAEELRGLELRLLLDPLEGHVIPRTNGARKVRVAAKGSGKRGGGRVIYVDVVVQERIYLLLAYPKNELENLTEDQRKGISKLIAQLKE